MSDTLLRVELSHAPAEGDGGETKFFTFTATRSGDLSGASSFAWAYTDDFTRGEHDALAGAGDFPGGLLPGGTVTFAPGEAEKTFVVATAGNDGEEDWAEKFRNFGVRISDLQGAVLDGNDTLVATIVDDDEPMTITVQASASAVMEGNSGTTPVTFTIERSFPSDGQLAAPVDVAWAVRGTGWHPAEAKDFGGVLPSGTVHFAMGETSKTVTVEISGDRQHESSESFAFTILGRPESWGGTSAIVKIVNDDRKPSLEAEEPALGGVAGTEGADSLTGTDGDDLMSGGGGADSLTGGLGSDVIYGNQDADLVYGNQGGDTLYGGQGEDTLFGGKDADVVYGNLGADVIYGNMGADALFGGQGADVLYGGQGDDILSGNLDDDTLFGGAGADLFVFRAGGGADLIADFSFAAGDRLDAGGRSWTVSVGGTGAVLDFGAGDTVTLAGISADQVTDAWFFAS